MTHLEVNKDKDQNNEMQTSSIVKLNKTVAVLSLWTHPEDAVTFPLGLIRVDCHSAEPRHLGDRLAQQICPQFAVHKHDHWRLVQFIVLEKPKSYERSFDMEHWYNVSTYRYWSKIVCFAAKYILMLNHLNISWLIRGFLAFGRALRCNYTNRWQ